MMVNWRNGTFYVGHTADLPSRVLAYREGRGSEFTRKHHIRRLVWYGYFETLAEARQQEYLIKRWKRQYKLELVEERNPHWHDLFHELA